MSVLRIADLDHDYRAAVRAVQEAGLDAITVSVSGAGYVLRQGSTVLLVNGRYEDRDAARRAALEGNRFLLRMVQAGAAAALAAGSGGGV